ncbi:MAG: T9SS type A sorting domain-containing protein [Owenweeksia sp.]|nr:T9SS type A sorting domain-containing protein [Owenweeksia sp.]
MTLNLNIKESTSSVININQCGGSYTSPSGKVFTTSGTYQDTIPNGEGCDSLITINLNLDPLQVTAMELVNAPSGTLIAPLSNGYTINKSAVGSFSVEAIACSGTVGSVKFFINGSLFQTESVFPYAINGDNPPGQFNHWNPSPGTYTIVATPYSGGGGNGTAGGSLTLTINVVDNAPIADCNGDIGGSAYFNDCNECVGGNTGKPANFGKDDCGVCNGNNADKDCAGVCFGTAVTDDCGDCVLGTTGQPFNGNCNVDCAGIVNGTASLDSCGICSGGTTGKVPNADKDTCGVCFGNNLSCAPCQPVEVIGLTLVNVSSGADIATLTNGYTIVKSAIGPFSVRAEVCDASAVGSVRFFQNGSQIKNENIAPYTINGDNSSGYHPWNPAPGTYIIAATPYSNVNGNGTTRISEMVTITIVDNAPIADCNGDIGGSAYFNDCNECVGGNTGKPANFGKDDCGVCNGNNADKDCAGVCFGTAVTDDCGDCVLGTTGQPFNGNCNVDCAGIVNGTASLDSCGICSGGTTGKVPNADKDTCGVCFGNNLSCAPCQPLEVVSITLMHSGTAGPIRILNAQDTIIRSQIGNFSARADVCSEADVESVRFFVDGNLIQNENLAPYAVAGDQGGNGSFRPWNIPDGHYTLTATPYSSNNGNGTVGISTTIDLWILDTAPSASITQDYQGSHASTNDTESNQLHTGNAQGTNQLSTIEPATASPAIPSIRVYPNPTSGTFTIEVSHTGAGGQLVLMDVSGKILYQENIPEKNGQILRELDLGNYAKGIYMIKLRSDDQIYTQRVIKN